MRMRPLFLRTSATLFLLGVTGIIVMISFRAIDWSERYELPGMPCVFHPGQTRSVFLKLRHTGLRRIEIPLHDESVTKPLDYIVRGLPEGHELARGKFLSKNGRYIGTMGPLWIPPGQSIQITLEAPKTGESIYFGCLQNKGIQRQGERLMADLVFLYARDPFGNALEWVDRRILPFIPFQGSAAVVIIMMFFPSIMAFLAWIVISAYAEPDSDSS